MSTGPRPMQPAEWEAYTLHLQREPVETIEKQTGLSRPRIAAAVDLGRRHAQSALQPAAEAKPAPRRPAPPRPVRVRRAALQQLPGARTPPGPAIPEAPRLLSPQDAPVADTAAATVPSPPAPPAPPAAPAPAATPATSAVPNLDRLARSPKVRAWAAREGWAIPPSRRLPGAIVLAYITAHGGNK